MTYITAENVTVTYNGTVTALEDLELAIDEGEFVTLLGPSGCGKSTLLKCLGGLLSPTRGRIRFGSEAVGAPDPNRAAFVFQDYSLLPWARLDDNVALGLKFQGVSKGERRRRAAELLDMVGLAGWETKHPGVLSGGMQQRVAVARGLAMQPEAMLLDEPFGALDEQTRRALGVSISTLLRQGGKTVVLVTHSLDEALYWADRVVVMSARPGRIIEELHIDEPWPRSPDVVATPEFGRLRRKLFDLLSDEPEPDARSAASV